MKYLVLNTHLDSEAGDLRHSAAEHLPMLLRRGGDVSEVEENGLVLAAFSLSAYRNAVGPLQQGDRVVLDADGILEAANAGLGECGQPRLQALI